MIRFSCPACQQHLCTAPAGAGSKIACPSCGQRVQAPAPPCRDASTPSEAETDGPRLARPYYRAPEDNRGLGYVVAAVCGVVGLKVLVVLLPIVVLIAILCIRLSLMR
jgi:hypothetical protein